MAMTLPIAIPSTPSSGNSPASDDSNPPRTPLSPNMQPLALPDQSHPSTQQPTPAQQAQMKRKPSRRANTAERRATHNAVERQRRETLNGRFLDLAALLPNLSQIRRPSKSSIVNSSIAHIHASRRHRLLAARELRLVKLESDALRRELNEWRDRAGLPRVEEPVRGEGFTMVLSGELEVLAAVPGDDDEDGEQGYGAYEDGEDDFPISGPLGGSMDDIDDSRNPMAAQVAMLKNANANPFAHNLPPQPNAAVNPNNGLHLAHILPRPTQGPMIASSPTTVSFENPAMNAMYEPHHNAQYFLQQQQQQQQQHPDPDKVAAWNAAHLYMGPHHQQQQQQQHMLQAQRSLFTPPATSHGSQSAPGSGHGNAPPNPFTDPNSQAFFANFQRQQQMAALQQQQQQMGGHIYGSPERDDTSSVGSIRGGRERSGSLSNGSGYGGSPPHHGGSPGSYEVPSTLPGDYGVPRRLGAGPGLHVNTSGGQGGAGGVVPGPWGRDELGMMKQALNSPIGVGGGGNGSGFAMIM